MHSLPEMPYACWVKDALYFRAKDALCMLGWMNVNGMPLSLAYITTVSMCGGRPTMSMYRLETLDNLPYHVFKMLTLTCLKC